MSVDAAGAGPLRSRGADAEGRLLMAAPSAVPRDVARRVALVLGPKVAELRAADAAAAKAARKPKPRKSHAPPGAA